MTDFLKSMKSILHERISSPFYGSLIVSWLLWNWKIPYVTLFVDSSKLTVDKIAYIMINCNDCRYLIYYPLISTVVILTVIPFITNGAYEKTITYNRTVTSIEN